MISQIQLAGELIVEGEYENLISIDLAFVWSPSLIEVDRDPTTEDDLAG